MTAQVPPAELGSPVLDATRRELKQCQGVDLSLGAMALGLARRIDATAPGDETGSAYAALSRELRNTMLAVRTMATKRDVPPTPAQVENEGMVESGDPADQLAERRRARRARRRAN